MVIVFVKILPISRKVVQLLIQQYCTTIVAHVKEEITNNKKLCTFGLDKQVCAGIINATMIAQCILGESKYGE